MTTTPLTFWDWLIVGTALVLFFLLLALCDRARLRQQAKEASYHEGHKEKPTAKGVKRLLIIVLDTLFPES